MMGSRGRYSLTVSQTKRILLDCQANISHAKWETKIPRSPVKYRNAYIVPRPSSTNQMSRQTIFPIMDPFSEASLLLLPTDTIPLHVSCISMLAAVPLPEQECSAWSSTQFCSWHTQLRAHLATSSVDGENDQKASVPPTPNTDVTRTIRHGIHIYQHLDTQE